MPEEVIWSVFLIGGGIFLIVNVVFLVAVIGTVYEARGNETKCNISHPVSVSQTGDNWTVSTLEGFPRGAQNCTFRAPGGIHKPDKTGHDSATDVS
jgi:hypothetical protein